VPELCREPFLLAHGKPFLSRVLDVSPTTNVLAHGKCTFFGSEPIMFPQKGGPVPQKQGDVPTLFRHSKAIKRKKKSK